MTRWISVRWIATLVALIVPLQVSLVAIAAYCQHEHAIEQQDHIGHHAHKHKAAVEHEGGAPSAHSDCDLSHSLSLKPGVGKALVAATPSSEPPVPVLRAAAASDHLELLYRHAAHAGSTPIGTGAYRASSRSRPIRRRSPGDPTTRLRAWASMSREPSSCTSS